MKKIKTISLTSLRVEECFGYLKLVLAETENLPEEETPSVLTASENAFPRPCLPLPKTRSEPNSAISTLH